MPKEVAIITRAYNRLEYTIKVIQSVYENTNYPHYKHIIVDNGSTDGTREWLNWIKKLNCERYNKIVPCLVKENYGDWGGMIHGAKTHGKDCQFIVQLDNDIEISKGWLSALIEVAERGKYDGVMLKRTGVKNQIKTIKDDTWKLNDGRIVKLGIVPFVVACYICPSQYFFSVCNNVVRCRDFGKFKGGKCAKIKSMTCYHIDGWNEKNKTYNQHLKYPKNKMTWEKFS